MSTTAWNRVISDFDAGLPEVARALVVMLRHHGDALLASPPLLASPSLVVGASVSPPSPGLRPHAANITTPTTHRAIIRPIYALMAQVAGKARCARMPAAGRPGAHAVTRSRGQNV